MKQAFEPEQVMGLFGRGYQGSTPTSHAQYAQVTLSPSFPRISIKKAINDTINSLYPRLWAVDSFTFTFNASQTTYALPDDLEQILFVSWQTTGSSKEWLPVNRWRADGMANIATFNSTNTINIYENIQPGRTVQVYYTTVPDTLDMAKRLIAYEQKISEEWLEKKNNTIKDESDDESSENSIVKKLTKL